MDGRLALHHSPFNISLRVGPGVPSNEVDVLHNDAIELRKDAEHPSRFSPVFARRHKNLIVLLNV